MNVILSQSSPGDSDPLKAHRIIMFQQHPGPFPGDYTKPCQEGNCVLLIFILRAQHKAWNIVGVTLMGPQWRLALVCDILGHFFQKCLQLWCKRE